jgi:methionyl-tRNA formyltransferase
MSKSKKLIFFGNERLATGIKHTDTPTLKILIKEGYEVVAVISNFATGRSRNARELEIAKVANENNIPVLLPTHVRDIKDDIKNLNADFGVLVAYGRIIPEDIIKIFPHGIINIHPSLLPKYRGPTPIEQAILDGAEITGTSIMRLVTEMDAGPVYAQSKISLNGNESKDELANKQLEIGSRLLIDNLPSILDSSLSPAAQDNSKATYTKLLNKTDGIISWDNPAEIIQRQIRAFAGYPKSRTDLLNRSVVITKSRVAQDKDDGELVMRCQPGWLEITELTAPSGRSMSGAEFLRGYNKSESGR